MKTRLALALLGALAVASPAAAAEIFGTISEGGSSVPAGVTVTLACGDVQATAKTDEFGSYSLRIATPGECKLAIEHKGVKGFLPVAVHAKPTRYDLVAKVEAGKLVLTRK